MFTSRVNVAIFYKKEYNKLYFHTYVRWRRNIRLHLHIYTLYLPNNTFGIKFLFFAELILFIVCRIHSYQLNNKLVLLRERHSNYICTCISKIFCIVNLNSHNSYSQSISEDKFVKLCNQFFLVVFGFHTHLSSYRIV